MLSQKFLKWLRKLEAKHGTQVAVEALTGIDQSRVSVHLKKPENGGVNVDLDTLQKVARRYMPKKPVYELLREIEREQVPEDEATEAERRADAAYRAWLRLFEHDSAKAERVLANLTVQEDLGLTELVSKVVHLIVTTHDPSERQRAVVNALADVPTQSRGKRFRQIVSRYATEYQNIH